jgi:hypothetical protein
LQASSKMIENDAHSEIPSRDEKTVPEALAFLLVLLGLGLTDDRGSGEDTGRLAVDTLARSNGRRVDEALAVLVDTRLVDAVDPAEEERSTRVE